MFKTDFIGNQTRRPFFDIWIERSEIQTPAQLSVESDIVNFANRDFVLRILLTKLFVTLSVGQFNSYEALSYLKVLSNDYF